MSDLEQLLERVKAATGPDRELDADIAQAIEGVEIQWRQATGTMEMYPVQRYPSTSHAAGFGIGPVPTYTASVDAALAFAERMLPGFGYSLNGGHLRDQATIWLGEVETYDQECEFVEGGETAPLAILAATLSALASQVNP